MEKDNNKKNLGYPFSYGDNLTAEESLERLKDVGKGVVMAFAIYIAGYTCNQVVSAITPTSGTGNIPPENSVPPTTGNGSSGNWVPPTTGDGLPGNSVPPSSTVPDTRTRIEKLRGISLRKTGNTIEYWVGMGLALYVIVKIIRPPRPEPWH